MKFLSLLASVSSLFQETSATKCTALAMSGGGAHGAFEAGVLWGFLKNDDNKDKYKYDIVTGVSAGSINAIGVAAWPIGDEDALVNWLSEQWLTLTSPNVYKNWALGIADGLLTKSGIFDSSPLFDLLTRRLKDAGGVFNRKLTVASANVNTGAYTLFNETDPEIVKGVLSSASIPFIFPHQHWKDRGLVMMDGGTIWNLNLVSAVQRCQKEIGAEDESDITIDLIVCGHDGLSGWEDRDNGYENYLRWKAINEYHSGLDDIFEFRQAFPKVNFRYFVQADRDIGGPLSMLDFYNSSTWEQQTMGRTDGKAALHMGEGLVGKEMDKWASTPELKEAYPRIGDYIS